jgi:uncharacterized protein (UPF0218 family)
MEKNQQDIINSLVKMVGELLEITEQHDNQIKQLQSTLVSTGDMVNNQNEGINLILQVLNANGLIDVDI